MKILFLTHAFNSLSQRLYVALTARGHEVSVEFDINDTVTAEAVALFGPDLILAPFLKRAIPEALWRRHCCLVVHPGPPGDRGPSALDRAILDSEPCWGVTVLQANGEMDAGDIWAAAEFPMRAASKASLYRNEVSGAAERAVLQAVERFASGEWRPAPPPPGPMRPSLPQAERRIDWRRDSTAEVLRKLRSADGAPGVRDRLFGRDCYLYDAHAAPALSGASGEVIARSGPALARATVDGAVWIGHLREPQGEHPFKLPATAVLGAELAALPEVPLDSDGGYREIAYEECNGVGYLHFPFYNGAMGTAQCERLLHAYREACRSNARVLVLLGGPDFWSNGMHLNLIEASASAADESWRNINAIDDLAEAIITNERQLTVAALRGNAGAGGVFLARAADRVWARRGVILNPHYKDMGNLYGSEYWSYLLPRYTGEANAARIARARLPMGAEEAAELGLVDRVFDEDDFLAEVGTQAEALAAENVDALLAEKVARRRRDETQKPLQRYRAEELERMRLNFYGFDSSYHVARYNFVCKVPKSRTPLTIAGHRRRDASLRRIV